MNTFISILLTLLIFTLIVVIHEGGHFFAARKAGVTVEEFAIGMGPVLFMWMSKKNTQISVRLFPIGGFCRMYGEETTALEGEAGKAVKEALAAEGSAVPKKVGFNDVSVWKRIGIVAAGPVMNFILALVLLLALDLGFGYVDSLVSEVEAGSPAMEAGLEVGDRILGIDGKASRLFEKFSYYLAEYQGEGPVELYVRKADGTKTTLSMTPRFDEELERYRVGFSATPYYNVADMLEKQGANRLPAVLGQVIGHSFRYFWYAIDMTLRSVGGLITGALGLEALSGPIGIVSVVSEAYGEGSAYGFWGVFCSMASLAMLLSANLGILNLFPIPGLDGSRIVILLIEKIRKKPLDPKVESLIYLVGFVLLIGLMVAVAVSDVMKLL